MIKLFSSHHKIIWNQDWVLFQRYNFYDLATLIKRCNSEDLGRRASLPIAYIQPTHSLVLTFMYTLKDKWAYFSWNWISASPHLFGHLSVSWFMNLTYLHQALTGIFIQYLILTVQTLQTSKGDGLLCHLTQGNFHHPFQKNLLFHKSFIHPLIHSLMGNMVKIKLTIHSLTSTGLLSNYRCSASFSMMFRYGLCSYRAPLQWSISHQSHLLYVDLRRRTSSRPFHLFIHSFKNLCVNINDSVLVLHRIAVCTCIICSSRELAPWHFVCACSA